ncbi:E3 SUMO-protein ligase ZBED1-like [Seriola aureovittata]|uniref:E3 SUMO-protein ligase ZBED1-like n=1 Tax=Seriola aureovittata TaxID=2871759 RepID=UPI0024BE67F6|nr:E3 SUMO-protein ligase ZBED1-like [Seriola aureovittata]
MLEHYVEQQPAVLMDEAVKAVKDVAILTASELKLAEELIQPLKPLKTITALMSTETSPSVPMILPLQKMLLKSMVPRHEDRATIKEAKPSPKTRKEADPDLKNYLQRATALHPRFKSLPFLDDASCLQLYRDLTIKILEHEQQGQCSEEGQAGRSTEPRKESSSPP